MWKNIDTDQRGLSAGRVQSTLLKILKDHENDISNHIDTYQNKLHGSIQINDQIILDFIFINKSTDQS